MFSPDSRLVLTFPGPAMKANGDMVLNEPGRSSPKIARLEVRLWNAATGAEVVHLPGWGKSNSSLRFSPDGKTVAYGRLEPDENDRDEVVLWDVAANRAHTVLRTEKGTGSGEFSPSGKAFFTYDGFGRMAVWDVATGRRLQGLTPAIDPLGQVFSPDGLLLAGRPFARDATGSLPDSGPSDLLVFRLSDLPLPPPLLRGEAAKPFAAVKPPRREPQRSKAAQALADLQKENSSTEAAARAIEIARNHPTDPAALEALAYALRWTSSSFGAVPNRDRDAALALIRKEYLRSPELSRLLDWLARQRTNAAFDLLAEIAEHSPHRVVQGRAAYQLATCLTEKAEAVRMLRLSPAILKLPQVQERRDNLERLANEDPQPLELQAEQWFERVRGQFADITLSEYQREPLGPQAQRSLFALRKLGIGQMAPEIEGEDLDGRRFRLSDYRGKVVVLIFCGNWCGPCRQMNPQKQGLVERLASKPFALLEVNSDEDREAVKRTMRKEKLTWRCWFDGGREGPIARQWDVHHWPTVFVLDAQGKIRYKELSDQPLEEAVQVLLRETTAAVTKPRP
jgi:peroxiredoxin